ncbi:uncharacterized protein LOC133532941 [Cydia pomonella]|uniref:uncharacterized protein LOC133532941 n=1 Tax=Cydia pomonella TaxID=82600 RepID=UPI002ADE12FC|nr:uncharacterized protein LOC133532941 [Cydia pomonella]
MKESFHEGLLYCSQSHSLELELPDASTITHYYGELAKSETITLLLQGHGSSDDTPKITTTKTDRGSRGLTDKHKQIIEETCYAFIKPWNVLSWYQTGSLKDILLNTSQLQDSKHKSGQWMRLNLKKTLNKTDIGTEIYCVQESVLSSGLFVTKSSKNPVALPSTINTSLASPHIATEPSNEVIIFDEKQELNFVCGGSEPLDGRNYTWYIQDLHSDLQRPEQHFEKSTNVNNLKLIMTVSYHDSSIFCAQDYSLNLGTSAKPYKKFVQRYGELAKSTVIKLLYRLKGNSQDEPQVTPKDHIDQGQSFTMLTCYAFIRPWDVLSWYQYKGSDQSEHTLLKTIQLQNTTYEAGQWIQLTLNKTLQPSDNGSEVYCAKQSVLPGGNYSEERIDSQLISLTFQKYITPLKPVTTIHPKSVNFDINATVQFTCSGSNPVDDRIYAWFRIEPDNNRAVPLPYRRYDESTNVNILELTLDEKYNHNKLFCAQVFRADIRDQKKKSYIKYYGEIAKSEIVTLKIKGKDDEENTLPRRSDKQHIIAVAVTIPVLIVLAAMLTFWLRRRSTVTVHEVPTATPTPNGTPKPAARSITTTPKERPKPAVRPKPVLNPEPSTPVPTAIPVTNAPTANSSTTKSTANTKRPTPTARPAIATLPKPGASQDPATQTAPTATATPKARPKPTARPDLLTHSTPAIPAPRYTPAPSNKEGSDAIYGNFITLFSDMVSEDKQPTEVIYAALELPEDKTFRAPKDFGAPKISAPGNIHGIPKTSASAGTSASTATSGSAGTNASTNRTAVTTLTTSESSPYAQIIGIYTPPNQ